MSAAYWGHWYMYSVNSLQRQFVLGDFVALLHTRSALSRFWIFVYDQAEHDYGFWCTCILYLGVPVIWPVPRYLTCAVILTWPWPCIWLCKNEWIRAHLPNYFCKIKWDFYYPMRCHYDFSFHYCASCGKCIMIYSPNSLILLPTQSRIRAKKGRSNIFLPRTDLRENSARLIQWIKKCLPHL